MGSRWHINPNWLLAIAKLNIHTHIIKSHPATLQIKIRTHEMADMNSRAKTSSITVSIGDDWLVVLNPAQLSSEQPTFINFTEPTTWPHCVPDGFKYSQTLMSIRTWKGKYWCSELSWGWWLVKATPSNFLIFYCSWNCTTGFRAMEEHASPS